MLPCSHAGARVYKPLGFGSQYRVQDKPFEIDVAPFRSDSQPFTPDLSARIPLQQHPLYLAALQTFGTKINTVQVRRDGQTILGCFMLERRFFGAITLTMGFRGPHFSPRVSGTERCAALRFLRKHYSPWRRQFVQLMPELVDTRENRAAMKRAGFTRIMTGTSTVWVDLSLNETDLRGRLAANWRNQLKKAEQSKVTIAVGGAKPKHYNWLLEKENEQRQSRGYSAIPLGLVPAYRERAAYRENATSVSEASPLMSVTAHKGGTQVAGGLFLLHGNSATYHIGWAGQHGRAVNAQNHVLFSAMVALKERGIKWLDMGGLDTGPQAAIARFKLGLGHPPETLVGTYIG